MTDKHFGASFYTFLKEEGLYEAARLHALKRTRRNPIAKALHASRFRPQIIKSKKTYSRKSENCAMGIEEVLL